MKLVIEKKGYGVLIHDTILPTRESLKNVDLNQLWTLF
jgi:hypothetical protein